jgi:hypothetical protein
MNDEKGFIDDLVISLFAFIGVLTTLIVIADACGLYK